jgi:hypothetical protein
MSVPRLVPDEPFPPYTFVPGGQKPHPFSDPAGHSFGKSEPAPAPLDAERWRESRTFLYGLDLFNAGFFWESHVQFEALWKAVGRKGPVADFLKGLIKLAAAGVKQREGKPIGVRTHARRAAELFRGVGQEVFLGFRVAELISLAEDSEQHGWPAAALVLLPS